MFLKRYSNTIIAGILLTSVLWGAGRAYFSLTDGFWVSNIISDLPVDPAREVRPLLPEEEKIWADVAEKPWHYLGKGCQSYVFESDDGKYVLKFFKYQRYRPHFWLEAISFLPPVQDYLAKKHEKKMKKLNFFIHAWKVAFDELNTESGVVFVHLNKSDNLKKTFTLYDKIGLKHTLPADNLEFLIQRKADMLVPWIQREVAQHDLPKVKRLLDDLVEMFVDEYSRGLSDNDHALMQNTGVFHDKPFHIDVGQFTQEERFKNPRLWHEELYKKTYNFRLWLLKNYPELGEHLQNHLKATIGEDWSKMKPYFGRIHD